jgi:hypothetical protein
MTQVNVESIIEAYVKLRDSRSTLAAAYKEQDEALKAKLDRLAAWLLAKMKEDNATQLGSESGTAYQQTRLKGNCSDWPTLWEYMAESRRFDLLEKRLSIKAVQEIYDETGELPPGVNISPELTVVVRRS